jgi:hypothetical protein
MNHLLDAVFKYPKGFHNVLIVNGIGFQQCVAPARTQPLISGNDVITLTTPGRKWYICGVAMHCKIENQKRAASISVSSTFSHLVGEAL